MRYAPEGYFFFFSSRRRHTAFKCDWSSDVCSSDLPLPVVGVLVGGETADGKDDVGQRPRQRAGVGGGIPGGGGRAEPDGQVRPHERVLAALPREDEGKFT